MRTAAVPGPRVCQSPVLILGSGGRLAFPCCSESEPLQEEDGRMRVLFERVAGIDVHKGHDQGGGPHAGTPGVDPHL